MISPPSQSFSRHSLGLSLGPCPARIRPGDQPTFFIFDASVIDASNAIFPDHAFASDIKRLMGLAAPTNSPAIFVTTPLEFQVLDDWKEKRKAEVRDSGEDPERSNLRNWIKAAEGKGIVSSYPDLRFNTYAHQYLVLDQVSEQSQSGLGKS